MTKGRQGRRRGGQTTFAALTLLTAIPAPGDAEPDIAVPPSLTELVEVTDISGLSASPDGRHVAFRTERAAIDRNSYVLTWHVAEASGRVRFEAGGGQPIYIDPGLLQTETAFWAPDGRAIYFRALVDDAIGLWRARLDRLGARAVVIEDADVEAVRPSADGRGLDFDLGPTRADIRRAEEDEYQAGILVDRSVDLAQNLFRGASINGRMATQRISGPWFRRTALLGSAQRRHRRLDLTSETVSEAEAPTAAATASASLPDFSVRSPGGALATAEETENGWRVEARLANSTRLFRCPRRPCETGRIAALAWRPGRDQLVITLSDPHLRQTLWLWDVARHSVRRLAGGEGLLSGGRDPRAPCALTARFAFCVAASATSPPRLERIAFDVERRDVVFDPNSALRARAWPRAQFLSWSGGGQPFAGVLLRPSEDRRERLPLLIHYYRCEGFLRGGVGDELPFAPLAQAGFAVLCINAPPFRGAHDALATYRTGLEGVRASVDLLAERGLIDRSRVGMAGLSFGSEVTMWTAVHSDLLAAASIASVQFESAYYWFNAVRGRDHPDIIRRSWGLGPPDEDVDGWRALSPALNVARIRAPLLLQLPEQESRYVIELYARLSNSTTPAELYAFPDEAHIKIQPRHKLAVYARNQDWFRFWLQDHIDPDPAKREQYRRWQALRERQASDPHASGPGRQP